jgi:hypothetical protein
VNRNRVFERTSLVDPDPAVDLLNILATVASLISISSFTAGIFERVRRREGRRIRRVLDESLVSLRHSFASLRATYRSILELQQQPRQSIGFRPERGLRVGQRSLVEAPSLTMLNRRRQQLIEECRNIQRRILRTQNALKSEGQAESPTYDFFNSLTIELNTILGGHEKALDDIERDVLTLLEKADETLAELQRWLAESNGSTAR